MGRRFGKAETGKPSVGRGGGVTGRRLVSRCLAAFGGTINCDKRQCYEKIDGRPCPHTWAKSQ